MKELFVIILCSAAICIAQDYGGLKTWGSLRTDLIGIQSFGYENIKDQFDYAGAGILTLNFKNLNSSTVKVESSADLILLYGIYKQQKQKSRGILLSEKSNDALIVDIRKLYAGFFIGNTDLYAGRQIINYGYGLVFSPVDIFSSVDIYDLSFARSGSDVIRLRIPLGATGGVEMTGGLEGTSHNAVAGTKVYTTVRGIDLSAVGIYKKESDEIIGGLVFKGDFIAGIYGEIAEHRDLDMEHQYFSGMLGVDYSLFNRYFFNAEYLFNEKTDSLANRQFTGKHNIFLSGKYVFDELSNIQLTAISDLENGSGFLTAQYSRNILQNANMILYSRYFYNDHPGMHDQIPDLYYGIRLEAAF